MLPPNVLAQVRKEQNKRKKVKQRCPNCDHTWYGVWKDCYCPNCGDFIQRIDK